MQHRIPQDVMTGRSDQLFGYIADIMSRDMYALGELDALRKEEKEGKAKGSQRSRKAVGFTFSFPIIKTALDSGVLVNWTKGFSVEGVVGRVRV